MKNDEFVLRPGLCQQLESAFERNGWTVEEVNEMTKGHRTRQLLRVLRGEVEINYPQYVVDSDTSPPLPKDGMTTDSWRVLRHVKRGPMTIGLRNDEDLYVNGRKVVIVESQKSLDDERTLNFNVWRFLKEHPHLIPYHWKPKVRFSGTIYTAMFRFHREENDRPSYHIHTLSWENGGWVGEMREESSEERLLSGKHAALDY